MVSRETFSTRYCDQIRETFSTLFVKHLNGYDIKTG